MMLLALIAILISASVVLVVVNCAIAIRHVLALRRGIPYRASQVHLVPEVFLFIALILWSIDSEIHSILGVAFSIVLVDTLSWLVAVVAHRRNNRSLVSAL
jgi:hypothetical protein